MKYAKFQHRSPDKITKYTALYLEKWSFCWHQQFARITQKPRASHTRHARVNCKAIKHGEWSRKHTEISRGFMWTPARAKRSVKFCIEPPEVHLLFTCES